jgi:hypothetical protein
MLIIRVVKDILCPLCAISVLFAFARMSWTLLVGLLLAALAPVRPALQTAASRTWRYPAEPAFAVQVEMSIEQKNIESIPIPNFCLPPADGCLGIFNKNNLGEASSKVAKLPSVTIQKILNLFHCLIEALIVCVV